VLLVGVYAGPAAEGERVMKPLRDFRQPLVDFSGTTTWLEAQQFFDEDYPAWARAFVEAMQEFSDGSRYFNFPGLDEEGDAVIQETFGSKHERLVALKNRYDPDNLFRLNSNIRPTV
jgi:FAD/FMN-containing dehydrogenase